MLVDPLVSACNRVSGRLPSDCTACKRVPEGSHARFPAGIESGEAHLGVIARPAGAVSGVEGSVGPSRK